MKKRVTVLAALAVAAANIAGCSKFSPEETAVSVGKDGEITAAVIEQLDQDYYKEDELKTAIDEAVAEFAAQNGEDSVSVEKYETEERKVTLIMKYADADTYAEFNNVAFFAGDMVAAGGAGYDFDTTFQSVEKGTVVDESVSSDEVLNSYNYNVVILEEEMAVEVPGKIVYVSSNVEVTGKNSARVLGSQEESQAETETEFTETESGGETVTDAMAGLVSIAPKEDQELESETETEEKNSHGSSVAYIIYE